MKSIRGILVLLAGLGSMLLVYFYVTLPVEKKIRSLWFESVVKPSAVSHRQFANTTNFLFGLYRPELPYEFGMTWLIQDTLSMPVTIIHWYQAWGSNDRNKAPLSALRNLHEGGYVPMITWEPWLSDFEEFDGTEPDSSLAIIANGTVDQYIRSYARELVRFGHPVLIRPGHEMSNPVYGWSSAKGNSPEIFKQFWHHVVSLFREEGAQNVGFVWTPYTAQDTTFWPGDSVVDWTGLNIFNYGTMSENGLWLDFFTLARTQYDAVKNLNTPVLVTEVGCVSMGGNKSQWWREMFHTLNTGAFPLIQGVVIFDNPASSAPNGLPADLSLSGAENIYSVLSKETIKSLAETSR